MTLSADATREGSWDLRTATVPVRTTPSTLWDKPHSVTASRDWVEEAWHTLQSFGRFEADWDSYGSSPFSRKVIEGATLLLFYYRTQHPSSDIVPHIAPVTGGGVQMDWDTERRGLEIEVRPDGRVAFLAVEDEDVVREGNVSARSELLDLFVWLHQG
jgi:hypothetical protein